MPFSLDYCMYHCYILPQPCSSTLQSTTDLVDAASWSLSAGNIECCVRKLEIFLNSASRLSSRRKRRFNQFVDLVSTLQFCFPISWSCHMHLDSLYALRRTRDRSSMQLWIAQA